MVSPRVKSPVRGWRCNLMNLTIQYKIKGGATPSAKIELPDGCPVCERLVVFHFIRASFNDSKLELQVALECPNSECKSLLLAWYHSDMNAMTLTRFEPPNLTQAFVSPNIASISPNFVAIYKQAVESKERGLLQIAGPGYRKAFEFLIKDYAKSIATPSEHPKIEKSFAGDVVKNFVPDTRIQAVAKRAFWLGNDETHYLRKWIDHDINDLVNLIKLTIHWIEIEIESKSYVDDMPE